jgi:hypothetical protein
MPRLPEKREDGKSEKGVVKGKEQMENVRKLVNFGPTPVFCLTGRKGGQRWWLELHVGAC